MCKSITEGGQRCAAHTREAGMLTIAQILNSKSNNFQLNAPEWKKETKALEQYSTTNEGANKINEAIEFVETKLENNNLDASEIGELVEQIEILHQVSKKGKSIRDSADSTAILIKENAAITAGYVDSEKAKNSVETLKVTGPISTGKTGTDAPPLTIEFLGPRGGKGTSRFYLVNPDDRESATEMGAVDALAAGLVVPSITTCIGMLKKDALVVWAANTTSDRAESIMSELQGMDAGDMAAKVDQLVQPCEGNKNGLSNLAVELRGAHKEKKDTAAARGTDVHALCEQLERGEITLNDIPTEYVGYVDAYAAFRAENPSLMFEYTEATVQGDGYAGTTDGIVTVNGKRYILDLKTNDKAVVYSSVGMQLAAAANANNIIFADGKTVPMPKINGGIGVGLNSEGKHQVFMFDTSKEGFNYQGFHQSIGVWAWNYHLGSKPVKALKGAI